MKISIEVSPDELAQLGVNELDLEMAVKNAVEGGLDIGGDTLYINDTVVIALQTPDHAFEG